MPPSAVSQGAARMGASSRCPYQGRSGPAQSHPDAAPAAPAREAARGGPALRIQRAVDHVGGAEAGHPTER
eukprot:3635642-Pleurochrysis_carterae.AAC.1